MFLIVSAKERCPRFLSFMGKQAKRLKFKLIVAISKLPPESLGSLEQRMLERGALRMQ
ncbi:MAG: hypothetical protein L0Y57_01930 [Beijerinckiaceae bacterium]|nr:hypothetical protein [Beijerinckiaceae bacterium]